MKAVCVTSMPSRTGTRVQTDTYTSTFTVHDILGSSQRKLIPLRFVLMFSEDKLITSGHAASGDTLL